MIPIAKPLIGEEEIEGVVNVLRSGIIAQGPRVKEFEERFAEMVGTRHAIAVTNGTAALDLALKAAGIGPGDEVITTPFTFIATSNSVLFQGARPVFVDIEEDTYLIDVTKIEERITPRTRAILPVHLYGQTADMDAINEIAEEHGLKVIEDAAQAHGATYHGRKAGSMGLAGTFSFYATKNITSGEGGMITTDSDEMNEKLRLLRNHGQSERYIHRILGYNLRMSDIMAAIGLAQMKKMDVFNEKRRQNAAFITSVIEEIEGLESPVERSGRLHVYHQYGFRVTDEYHMSRDELLEKLNRAEIGARKGYFMPIYEQPFYRDMGFPQDCPVAKKVLDQLIELPIHPAITDEELKYMADTLSSA